MPTITLTFSDGDRVAVAARRGETILAAARRAGIPLSSDCEVGDCQTCRASCLAGDIEYDELSSISLSQGEVDNGEILPCVAMAASDLEIRIPYDRGKLVAAKPFSVRIEDIRRLSGSVIAMRATNAQPCAAQISAGPIRPSSGARDVGVALLFDGQRSG